MPYGYYDIAIRHEWRVKYEEIKLDFTVAQIHPTPGLTMIGLFANQIDVSVLVSDKINQ
jgi:hypothetical protein